MKQIDNGRKNTSKAYFMNETNKLKIKNEKHVVYSEDRKYALVYTQEDYDFMERYWQAYYKDEYYKRMSIEDEIYDIFLDETGIEEFSPGRTQFQFREKDLMNEEIISFGGTFIMPSCIIDKQKSLAEGSDIIISNGVTDTKVLIISLKENGNDK
ncbi:MAG: hypothetical protein K8Q99_06845 [Acholeplasmataceae bacterium]|nr:hypothetical protein [Acholeplasmataceae bacterium]